MYQAVRLRDVAEALNLSETTVSRALSGKGRVSEATRKAVSDYISNSGYRPNMLAKGLAQKRAFSICVLLPPDAITPHQPFFQNCLMGICEGAENRDYSVLLTTVRSGDRTRLERLLAMENADGFVLMRAIADDPIVAALQDRGVPFVLVGSSDREGIVCVDEHNEENCRALTQRVLREGFCRPGVLIGEMSHLVNRSRLRGFELGVQDTAPALPTRIHTGLSSDSELKRALDDLLRTGCDAVFCGDDIISVHVLRLMGELGVRLPVISFYGSELLDLTGGIYASVESDAHKLGVAAAEQLLALIEE